MVELLYELEINSSAKGGRSMRGSSVLVQRPAMSQFSLALGSDRSSCSAVNLIHIRSGDGVVTTGTERAAARRTFEPRWGRICR